MALKALQNSPVQDLYVVLKTMQEPNVYSFGPKVSRLQLKTLISSPPKKSALVPKHVRLQPTVPSSSPKKARFQPLKRSVPAPRKLGSSP